MHNRKKVVFFLFSYISKQNVWEITCERKKTFVFIFYSNTISKHNYIYWKKKIYSNYCNTLTFHPQLYSRHSTLLYSKFSRKF